MPKNAGEFVHPGLVESFARVGHYNESVTIQETTPGRNSLGEKVGAPVTLHEDIPAMIGAPRAGMVGRESGATSSDVYQADYLVYLDRYLPDIDVKHKLLWDGREFNISHVSHITNKRFTWLAIDEAR